MMSNSQEGQMRRRRAVEEEEVDSTEDLGEEQEVSSIAGSVGVESPEGSDGGSDDCDFTNMDETRARLHEMIDTCQELDEQHGFHKTQDRMLFEQVEQSTLVFGKQFAPESHLLQKSKSALSAKNDDLFKTPVASGSKGSKKNSAESNSKVVAIAAESPQTTDRGNVKQSDMYLAFRHTNICSQLMRKRTGTMGLEESCLSVEEYVLALKEELDTPIDDERIDTPELRMRSLFAEHWKTAPSLSHFMVGAFDSKQLVDIQDGVATEKPIKKDVTRRIKQFNPNSLIANQEEVNISAAASQSKSKANDEAVRAFRQNLMKFSNNKDKVDLFEFVLNKESVGETLNNFFNVAFGVRDGTIAMNRDDGNNALCIIPTNTTKAEQENKAKRRQSIISFSASQIRKMQAAAEGENAISVSK